MGFAAESAVEPMDFDLNPYVELSGTIPEPSSQDIEKYQKSIAKAYKDAGVDPSEIESQGVPLDRLDEVLGKSAEINKAMIAATATLTAIPSNKLKMLPHRILQAFLGWVMGQFLNPEG
ncbi:MAG: hypothetical protein ACRDQA_22910 [Nocardioidaceae bacterium]